MKNGLRKITALVMTVLVLLACFCAGAWADEQYSDSVAPGLSLYSILDPETPAATYVFFVGETEYARQIVKNGEILHEPQTPFQSENAVFKGWYTEDGAPFTDFGTQKVTTKRTVKLTAHFETVYYVYFYTPDGGTLKHTETVTNNFAPYDFSGVTYEAGSTKKVTGWADAPNGTTDISRAVNLNGQGSIKLYAIETSGYWVIFHTGEGSVVAPEFLAEGDTLWLSGMAAPTCIGYRFGGWYDNAACDGNAVTSVSAAAELYAKWIPVTVNYTVVHWWENADDDEFSFHESETKTGLTQAQTAAAAKTYPGFTAQTIEQKTIEGDGSTIVGVYYKRNLYDVKFYTRDGRREYTEYQIKAKYGQNIKDKWPGGTWYVSPWDTVMQSRLEVMPLNGMSFYGKNTEANKAARYYIEVLPGESGINHNGKIYQLDHTDYWPKGAWVTIEDRYDITGFTFYEGTPLRESREPIEFYYTRNSYNIVFINCGATDRTVSRKYEQSIADADYTPVPPADKEGFIFAGWYDNELGEGEPYVFKGKTMPANNITVYAKWTAPTYTVRFDLGYEGATGAPDDQTVERKQTAVQPEAPTREGFTFVGWYNEEGKLFSFETPIVRDTKLTAHWLSSSSFQVVYDANGGSGMPPQDDTTYAEGAKAAVADKGELMPPQPTEQSPSQKVFLGWAMRDDAKEADYQPGDALEIRAEDAVNQVITLYAVWGDKPETTTLIYNANYIAEGESEAQIVLHAENGSTQLPVNATVTLYGETTFVRPGYALIGWAKSPDAQTPDYACGAEAMIDHDGENVLYAVWERRTADVTLNKQVTGGLGDKLKEFVFAVSCSEAFGGGEGYSLSSDGKEASFTLSHGQSVTLKDVPIGAKLTIREENTSSYRVSVTVNGEAAEGEITVQEDGNTIVVTNNWDVVPDMGVFLDSLPYMLILAVVAGFAVFAWVRRRRNS